MKRLCIIWLFSSLLVPTFAQEFQPKVFSPEVISLENRSEFGSVYNKAQDEFYFAIDEDGKASILYSYLDEQQQWSAPKVILTHEKYGFNDPFLSPDEKELYYISDLPRDSLDTIDDIDIWYSELRESGWSEPINAGPQINSDKNEYYISFTSDGKMYFSSNKASDEEQSYNFDIYTSVRNGDHYEEAVALKSPINTDRYEADVFIAPDESYIIYCSNKQEGYGRGDLYISFKDKDGSWKEPKNMGSLINSKSNELCPFVTADGKYFLYTSKQDIYYVDAKLLDTYR